MTLTRMPAHTVSTSGANPRPSLLPWLIHNNNKSIRFPAAGATECGKCQGANAHAGAIQRLWASEDQIAQHSAGHKAIQAGHTAPGHALHQAANQCRRDGQRHSQCQSNAIRRRPSCCAGHAESSDGLHQRRRSSDDNFQFPQCWTTRHGKCQLQKLCLCLCLWCV